MHYVQNGVDQDTGEVLPPTAVGRGHVVTSTPEDQSYGSMGRLQTLLSAALERNAAADERLTKASKLISDLRAKVATLEQQVSEKREHFHRQLALAQQEFRLIAANKESSFPTKRGGEVHLSYADLGDMLEAIRPILGELGISCRQPVLDHPTDPSMTTVQTILACDGYEEVVSSFSFSTTAKVGGDFKELGSAVTYVRRYTLAASLGLATEGKSPDKARGNGRNYQGGYGGNSRSSSRPNSNGSGQQQRPAQQTQQGSAQQQRQPQPSQQGSTQQANRPQTSPVQQTSATAASQPAQSQGAPVDDIAHRIRMLPFTEVVELFNGLDNEQKRQYKPIFDERRAQHQAQMRQAA